MHGDDWQQVWAIFERALERDPQGRTAFLQEACAGQPGLRRSVEKLLAADDEPDSFLDRPIAKHGSGGRTGTPHNQLPAQQLANGSTIGPYRILRRIGQGGMSTVYLAVRADDAFHRRMVIKLIRPGMESEALQERLRTERQILASLDHPYIARLYDGGTTDDGLPYFVLEYIEGIPIDEFCEQNQLAVDECLTLFRKVCSAVESAHQNLVVHRDLKPSNILVTADGDPKLLDFGIAKLLNPELGSMSLEPTATWHRILTPNYASPEQIRGKLITTASDVFSLGVLLYKLLTGRLPHQFSGRSPHEIEDILSTSEPVPPSVAVTGPAAAEAARGGQLEGQPASNRARHLRRRLTGDLDAIVLKALRNVPMRRYASVTQLAEDIERFQTGRPVAARVGSWRYRTGLFVRRHRRGVGVAAALTSVLVGFVVASSMQAARIAAELEQTRRERDKKTQVLALVRNMFEHSNPYVVPGKELTVREALERSVPVLEDALHGQPEVRAELLETSGTILGVLGVLDMSRDQLTEALEIRRQQHIGANAEVVATLSALAATEKELGQLDRAEALARQAVAMARQLEQDVPAPGPKSIVSQPLNELVSVLCYRNELEAAEPLAMEAQTLTQQLPVGNPQRLAATWHLARIRSAQGDYREAVRLNRETLAMRRIHDGEHHPGQIATLNNLGLNLRRLEDFEAAEKAYREAVELQRSNFGPEHDNDFLLNNLAGVLFAMGDVSAAEALYREARDIAVRQRGPKHWTVFVFELRIARCRTLQGATVEAEHSLRELLDTWRPELENHWRYQEGLSILGESLSTQGRCDEAGPILTDAFENLLGKATERTRRDAFERLRSHLERCGQSEQIASFEAKIQPAMAAAPPAP